MTKSYDEIEEAEDRDNPISAEKKFEETLAAADPGSNKNYTYEGKEITAENLPHIPTLADPVGENLGDEMGDIVKGTDVLDEYSQDKINLSMADYDAFTSAQGRALATAKELSPLEGKISKDVLAGLGNTRLEEKVPTYSQAPCETVYSGKNNTWIILGRDRDKGLASGYGGRGDTRAGAIDIVVGLQGWAPQNTEYAEKNFGSMANDKIGDAARIYISQRADIDRYFDICDGSMGSSKARSAIGIKADSVRIMARRGIKMITGQSPQQRSSLGGKLEAQFGIDLIAGNRDNVPTANKLPYLQPIPKGYNLIECLEDAIDMLGTLNSLISDFIARQMIINCAIAGSPIAGAAGPVPVVAVTTAIPTVSKKVIEQINNVFAELMKQQVNINTWKLNYLTDAGGAFINSTHNRTN
jgi:hypothetical protein